MHALALALLFVAADPVTISLEWGGDLTSTSPLAAEVSQDANAGSGGTASETAAPGPVSVCQCGCGKVGCTCSSPGAAVAPPTEAAAAPSSKPKVTLVSPATWDCTHCPTHRNQDWSDFEVTHEKRDGLSSYPCTEWTDKRGVVRRLYGLRKPSQVMWSWKATQ